MEVGDKVIRIGSATDSYTGRTGEVVEIDLAAERARVRWLKERNGSDINPPNGMRTWVAFKSLSKMKEESSS